MDSRLDEPYKPIIIPAHNFNKISLIKKTVKGLVLVDAFEDQLEELFTIRYPKSEGNTKRLEIFINKFIGNKTKITAGNWVYYPWRKYLVRILNDKEFQEVRMSRNYPLITKSQQKKFYGLNVGVVGLSVGNSIVKGIIYSGGAKSMKLADPDKLSLSNLNRIQAGVADLGLNKSELTARQIYEVNPYAQLSLFTNGIDADNIKNFFVQSPKLDLVVDAADDLVVKFNLRLMARALKIPLLMTTDNGLESNTQVLRFDKDTNSGGMKSVPFLDVDDILMAYKNHESLEMSNAQKLKVITELIGPKNVSSEMQLGSMLRAKEKIAGWPQVAVTVFLGGALAAYAAQLIASGARTYKRQTSFSFKKHLKPSTNTLLNRKSQDSKTEKFIKFLKSF